MKRLKLLIITLTISCTTFSQGLLPTLQRLDGDTVFCFTIIQSKELAKRIEANTYCDSLMREQFELLDLLGVLNTTKDSINAQLEGKIINLKLTNQNQGTSIDLLERTLELKNKKLKKSKGRNMLLGIGLGIMAILAIAT